MSDEKKGGYFRELITDLKSESKKARFLIEIMALIVLAFYASETRRTNNLTQTAIQDARNNFIKDQAPYVWITPQSPTVILGEPLTWNVHYSNYGRSPALNLHSCIRAAYGPVGLSGVTFPSMSDAECSNKAFRSLAVVPPGFQEFSTAGGQVGLTERDVKTIKSLDGGALIVGVFQYDDASGHTYETGFCSYLLVTRAISHCEKYNYIKQIK